MKTKEELNTLKKEVEAMQQKLGELTEDELAEVAGGLSAEEIVDRVIRGDYGNGQERTDRLRAAGYDYGLVKRLVDERLGYGTKRPDWSE